MAESDLGSPYLSTPSGQVDKTLVLFDAFYPYGNGEAFLESEMPFLSAKFRNIRVVPMGPLAEHRRNVPTNVTVFNFGKRRKLLALLGLVASPGLLAKSASRFGGGLRKVELVRPPMHATRAFLCGKLATADIRRQGGKATFYSYWLDHNLLGEAALARSMGSKVASRAHRYEFDPYEPTHLLPERTNAPDRIYAISQLGVDILRKHRRRDPENVVLSRLGVKKAESPSPSSSDGVLRVASCSFVHARKRVDLIHETLDVACKKGLRIEWHHFGSGPDMDAISARVDACLNDNLNTVLHGSVQNAEILEFYRSNPTDLFMQASVSEGVSVAVMEALAHGIPCLATDAGATAELVDDTCGKVVPVEIDAETFASAAVQLVSGSDFKGKRAGALRRWSERADAERLYHAFADELASL